MLNGDVAKTLDLIASELKSEERNYQIGVGTVAARLLESLSAHPEMIEKLLAEYAKNASKTLKDFHEDENTSPKSRSARRA